MKRDSFIFYGSFREAAPPGRAVTRRPLLPAHPGRRSFLRFPRLHRQRNLWIRFFPAAQNQWFRILSKSRNLM